MVRRGERCSPGGSGEEGLGAVSIWCRRIEAVPCSTSTAMSRYGSPAWESSGGDSFFLLLFPSFVSSPFFLSLSGGGGRGIPLVARVLRGQPWGLYRRGTRVLARTPKRNGSDGMAMAGDAWRHQYGSVLGFWARDQAGSCARGWSSRQLRQAVASARQRASRRGAPRAFTMRRGEKAGEARR